MLRGIKRNFKNHPPSIKRTLCLLNIQSILECAGWVLYPQQNYPLKEFGKIWNRAAWFILHIYGAKHSISTIKSDLDRTTLLVAYA